MTRAQRKAHALIWTVLAPVLLGALIATILFRPSSPAPSDIPESAAAAPVSSAPTQTAREEGGS